MPLSLETAPAQPNAIFAPQIMLQTCIVGGKLHTSARICLAAAKVDDLGQPAENWTPTGQSGVLHIGDVSNLEQDLAALQSQVDATLRRSRAIAGQRQLHPQGALMAYICMPKPTPPGTRRTSGTPSPTAPESTTSRRRRRVPAERQDGGLKLRGFRPPAHWRR